MRRAAVAVAAALLLLLVAGADAGHPEPTCPRGAGPPFLDALGPRCPRIARIAPSHPLEVRGDAVDKELNLRCGGASCSILFYAAWCPFSSKFRPIFDALSTMFPQIHHFAVEESSSMPRYGIRGFPAILLVNGTTMVRYRGTKDLKSLMHFYEETTGLDPVTYIDVVDQQEITGSLGSAMPGGRSLRKMAKDEPFVFLGALFIILKAVAHFVPTVISHLRAFLIARVQNLNLRIRRVSSQLMERALTVLDVKRLWSNLRLSSKTRDLRKGASNARAWASSFASVSLGEPSSLRHA